MVLPVPDSLLAALDVESLRASIVVLGALLRDIAGLDHRAGDALLAAIQYLGSFALIGWTTRRLLERWLVGESYYERDRRNPEAPRWRCLLGFWRRIE